MPQVQCPNPACHNDKITTRTIVLLANPDRDATSRMLSTGLRKGGMGAGARDA